MGRLLVFLAAVLLLGTANGQDFPSKAVRLVVPFPPGGPTDVVGRMMAAGLQAAWNQPVVVENKPGAGTVIGTDAVAKSPADGHTVGMVITAHFINPALRAGNMPYDTLKDLAHVTQLVQQHVVLVAHAAVPFNTLPELISHARSHPGRLQYASPGTGTSAHLAAELLKGEAKIDLVHVPYKGSGPAQTDLLAGRVELMVDVFHSAKPHVEAGRLKVIALTAKDRPVNIRQYPLVAETLPGFDVRSLFGFVVPAGTPRAVVQKIRDDAAKVLNQPDVKAKLETMGLEVVASTPEQFDALVRAEMVKWAKVVKDNNIKAD